MNDDFYLMMDMIVLFVTAFSLIYMVLSLKSDKWYLIHASPLLLYSLHVMIFYSAVILRRWWGIDIGIPFMPWSLALRLHGALMVAIMARTVVICHQKT